MILFYPFKVIDIMAEALAIVGLAAALIQFVDFGTKLVRRLRQLETMLQKVLPA